MAIPLKQSTASQEVPLGQFVDETDGFTPENSLTINNTDIKLWKNGTTTLADKNSGGATNISNGVYHTTLDATDTNTLGPMIIYVLVSGARPVKLECIVYPANVFDSLFAGSDKLQVDVDELDGSTSAATRAMQLYTNAIAASTVAVSPAPTTTQFAGGLTGASYPDNCFRNAAIVFTSGSNAGLTPHPVASFTSSSGLFTFAVALPFAPSSGDTFLIVGVTG